MDFSQHKRIKLTKEHISFLQNLPETGMGYQLVKLTLNTGTILLDRIVVNSQFLLISDNEIISPDSIMKIEIEIKK